MLCLILRGQATCPNIYIYVYILYHVRSWKNVYIIYVYVYIYMYACMHARVYVCILYVSEARRGPRLYPLPLLGILHGHVQVAVYVLCTKGPTTAEPCTLAEDCVCHAYIVNMPHVPNLLALAGNEVHAKPGGEPKLTKHCESHEQAT